MCGAAGSVAWESRIAKHERDRAQKHFNDVRGLAKTVIFDLQNKLAQLPGTTEVRKDLVMVAINYLDGLARDTNSDRGLENELAAAYVQIGNIQGNFATHNLGDLPSALTSYNKAERLARKLMAEQASDEARNVLVNALTAQAYGLIAANDKAQGALKATEALQIARERVRFSSGKEAQIQLGAALQCAANFADGKDARTLLLEEAAVFEHLLTRDSHDLRQMRNAALAHKYVAASLEVEGDPDAAFEHLQRAEELDRACVRGSPNDPEHKMDLSIDLSQWGDYFERKGDIPRAIDYIKEAVAMRRELAAADPRNARAQDRLAYILGRLGALQLRIWPRRALATYEEAESIARRLPNESLRRMELAASLSGIGAAYRMLGEQKLSCSAYAHSVKLYHEDVKMLPHYAELAAEARKAYASCPGAER
jgi:tetratricopeptide (TPR) repeat protein